MAFEGSKAFTGPFQGSKAIRRNRQMAILGISRAPHKAMGACLRCLLVTWRRIISLVAMRPWPLFCFSIALVTLSPVHPSYLHICMYLQI